MPHKDPEARRAYHKAYRIAHKEQNNEHSRTWVRANPERRKRHRRISTWKKAGVVSEDFDALYDQFLAATHCADCGLEFAGEWGDGQAKFRCLDHCHETGAFRDVVCVGCNTARGYADRAVTGLGLKMAAHPRA
jgi:hypothetical protein